MLNENNQPMPDWLPANVHHALIGCLRCQEVCPHNRSLPEKTVLELVLDEAETQALLSCETATPQPDSAAPPIPAALPPDLEKKLIAFGMHKFFLAVLGRNTRLVLKNC